MFFLLCGNEIIYSTTAKNNTVIMLLEFCKKKEIKKIVILKDFNVFLAEGEYLVQMDDEGFQFEHMKITQTGVIRDYREIKKVSKIHLQEYLPIDTRSTPEEKAKLIGEMDMKIIF